MNRMDRHKLQLYFLWLLLGGITVLALLIFRPLLAPFAVAVAFAVVFHPLYARLLAMVRGYQGIAAFLATILVVVFVVAPLILLAMLVFQEAWDMYISIASRNIKIDFFSIFSRFGDKMRAIFPLPLSWGLDISSLFQQGLSWLIQNVGALFSNVATIILDFFIFLIALYYLFKDGVRVRKAIVALSPFGDRDDEAILRRLAAAINSVVRGGLVVALVQGVMTAVGFMLFGVPSPILWGTVAAIAALIPTIGTALVLVPAIVFLFLTGPIAPATGLLLWGIVAVGLIDNFLGPKLIGGGTHIHPLAIFLSVLGGIAFFGPVGFLLGPLTMSLLVALLDIYFIMFRKEQNP